MNNNLTEKIEEKAIVKTKGKSMEKAAMRIFILVLTFGVISMLLMSGPANAAILRLNSDKSILNAGETVVFNGVLQVTETEYNSVSSVILRLNGPSSNVCTFDVHGNIIAGCGAIGVQSINVSSRVIPGSAYSYSYGYGIDTIELTYTITLSTEGYAAGTYSTSISVTSAGQTTTQAGNEIVIKTDGTHSGGSHTYSITKDESLSYENGKMGISKGDKYQIYGNSYISSMEVKEISGNSVKLLVGSQEIELKVGDTQEIDLDGDGKADLSVGLWYVGDDGKATIFIKSNDAKVKKVQSLIKLDSQNAGTEISNSMSTAGSEKLNLLQEILSFMEKYYLLILMGIIDLIFLELIGIIYSLNKRKRLVRRKR
jgi:hypothetical protein